MGPVLPRLALPLLPVYLLVALGGGCRPSCSGGAARQRVTRQVHEGVYRAVAANAKHTCALDRDGLPLCFGGDDTRSPPMTPAPREPMSRLETGRRFACGLTAAAGELRCWGDCSAARCEVPAGRFSDLALDDESGGCAWDVTGRAVCWGNAPSVRRVPEHILASGVRDLVLGTGWGLVLREDGTLAAWGQQAIPRDATLVRAIRDRRRFAAIAGRGAAACLIDGAGTPTCITYYDNARPPQVGGRAVAIDFSNPTGAVPACVMVEHAPGEREVACSTTLKGHRLPRPRGPLLDFGVGDDHLCTLREGGQLACAGHDLYGAVTGRLLGADARWP